MTDKVNHGLQIAVLDRGWVFVGHVSTDAEWCYIDKAECVRIWGTTRGIGELAENGPLPNTKLDPSPTIHVSIKALLFLVKCNAEKWKRCSCECSCHKDQ